MLLHILGGGGVVVGEKGVAEDGDGEGGFEGGEVRFCYSLVVIQDGDLYWGWGNGRHVDGSVWGMNGEWDEISRLLLAKERLKV